MFLGNEGLRWLRGPEVVQLSTSCAWALQVWWARWQGPIDEFLRSLEESWGLFRDVEVEACQELQERDRDSPSVFDW